MKQIPCQQAVSRNLAHIALVIFLAVLLIQSAIGLFVTMPNDGDSIDIVFRTAISSIFGYIMSSIGQKKSNSNNKTSNTSESDSGTPRQIGFSGETSTTSKLTLDSTKNASQDSGQTLSPPQSKKSISPDNLQLQTVIIACLGLFCMTVLIFLRYYEGEIAATSGVIATVAQYRDIISGSIGALIGLARGHES